MIQQPPPGSAGNKDIFSPRKKKGQITFAQSSFLSSLELGSLEESNNKKVAEDVQFLYSQLQRTKKDRDVAIERCEALEMQLQATQKHFKESSTRRNLEEDAFRRLLVTAKADFDKKLVKLALKAKDREDMLVDWVAAITDHKLEQQHEHLKELLQRTAALLPPSLREMMRRNNEILRSSTGRTTKSKKGTRAKKALKGRAKASSITSADPDALLAIINENISVLDNFNLKHMGLNNDVSDSENLIQGGYQDYLNSSNDEGDADDAHQVAIAHAINAQPKGHHYSGLSTHAKAKGSSGHPSPDGDTYNMNERQTRGSSPQSRAYTSQSTTRPISTASRDTRSRGSHSRSPKNASRKGARPRRKVRTPGGRERNEDSDSGESGTVTGSIMDHNETASDEEAAPGMLIQYEMPQQYGVSEEEQQREDARLDAALYDMSLSKSLSLTAPDPAAGGYGGQQSYYAKPSYSPVPSNSRTPRSTEVGYSDQTDFAHDTRNHNHNYGGDSSAYPGHSAMQADSEHGAGSQGDEAGAGADEDQFIETMRGLQEIVGQRPVSGGAVSDKRKMSEMSAQYTDMVRNILDSMSELSKSFVQEEGSDVDGGGSGIGREIAAMAGMGAGLDRSPPKPTSRGQLGSPDKSRAVEASNTRNSLPSSRQNSGPQHTHGVSHGAPLKVATDFAEAPAAVPSTIEALLVQAGVSLDAISNLSDDAQYASNDYPSAEDANKAVSPTNGGGGYSDVDIARMIQKSQQVVSNDSVENSDAEGAGATAKAKGKGAKKKKVTKGKKSVGSDSESDVEALSAGAGPTASSNNSRGQAAKISAGTASHASPVRTNTSMMAAGARALGGGSQLSQHSQLSQLSASNPPGGASGGNKSAYGESGDYSMNFDSIVPSKSKSGAASGNVSAGDSLASRSRVRAEEDSQYLKLGGDWDSHSESSQQPARNAGSYSNYSSYSNNQYVNKR